MEEALIEMIKEDKELIFLLENIKIAKTNGKNCDISFQIRSNKIKNIVFFLKSLNLK